MSGQVERLQAPANIPHVHEVARAPSKKKKAARKPRKMFKGNIKGKRDSQLPKNDN